MSKSKKVKVKQKNQMALVPIEKKEKALVVVEKKKLKLATIFKNEVFKEAVKKVSLVLIGTASIGYIALMVIVATSIFYVAHLENGFIQSGVFVNRD